MLAIADATAPLSFMDADLLLAKAREEMEAEKKAGLIVGYQIYAAQPHNPQEADIYLLVTYKNWAALDGLAAKSRALLAQVYGSIASAQQSAVDRGKIRTVLGSEQIQELILK